MVKLEHDILELRRITYYVYNKNLLKITIFFTHLLTHILNYNLQKYFEFYT